MNYQSFTVEELVQDKYFRKWVLDPDSKTHEFWNSWLDMHPEQANIVSQARDLVLLIPEIRHVYHIDREGQLWNKIVQQINSQDLSNSLGKVVPLQDSNSNNVKGYNKFFISTLRIAASLLIIISFVATYLWVNNKTDFAADTKTWIVKENPYGQRSTILLSDGTEVTLNAGSKLSYPEQYDKDSRTVMLEGEAFFRVTNDPLRPFEVITENIITQALGTSFNVRAFSHEPLQVSLMTGKVRINQTQKDEQIYLLPGECAIYDTLTSSLTKGTFDEKMVLAWRDGIIYFQDADQQTVFEALEKWYGVKISVINTSHKVWRYTGQFKNMNLEQFLETLQFSMDFQYEIRGNQVTIEYL